jgi:rare lipoprotein A
MLLAYAICLMLINLAFGPAAFAECGIASTYSSGSLTADGERYNRMGISAAHRSLPFGTRVAVRNQRTGRSITVRINDRGPFVAGRIIDLSTGAQNALGMDGLAPVCLKVVSYGSRIKVLRRTELTASLQLTKFLRLAMKKHRATNSRGASECCLASSNRRPDPTR